VKRDGNFSGFCVKLSLLHHAVENLKKEGCGKGKNVEKILEKFLP